MNYFELHIGDYAKATRHLTMLEHGAYSLLLHLYYDRERPFEADLKLIQRIAGARSEAEMEAVEAVLKEFFTLEDGFYRSKRADEEIEKYNKKSEKARASAAASVAVRQRQTNAERTLSERSTNAKLTRHQTPDTKHQEKTPYSPPSEGESEKGYSAEFEAFWTLYPRKTGKGAAAKAYSRAKRQIGACGAERIEKAVRGHLKAWAGKDPQFIPHPATWLNQARWEDEPETAPVTVGGKKLLPHQIGRNALGVGG